MNIEKSENSVHSPGPGAYTIKSDFPSGPKYKLPDKLPRSESVNTKHENSKEQSSPGYYYSPPPLGSQPFKINYPKRNDKPASPRNIQKSYSQSVAGPGQFNIPVLPNMPSPPAYTISPRNKKESWMQFNDNPSPLDYSPKIENSGPKYTIRNGGEEDEPRQVSLPGPADYPYRPKTKRYAYIHGTTYEPKTDETPGPGKYHVEAVFANSARKCAIRPCVAASQEILSVPYYNPKATEFTRIKGLTIPKSARVEKTFESTPGPAAYSPQLFNKVTGHKLPPRKTKEEYEKDLERQKKKWQETPGPASYKINWKAIDNNTPSFGFYGERAPATFSDDPGPASYSPRINHVKHSAPAYTIKSNGI